MNKQGRDVLYVVAGGYLLYLSYSLLGGLKTAGGTEKIISMIACTLFTIIGIYLVVTRLKRILAPQQEESASDGEIAENEIIDEETASEETQDAVDFETDESESREAADDDRPTV